MMRRPSSSASLQHRGFTLIELLAVAFILGLAGAVAGVSLSGRSASAQLLDARTSFVSLDAAARIKARKSHTVELRIDRDESMLTLIDRCCNGDVFSTRHIDAGITIEAWDSHTNQSLNTIRYNALGHSTDYVVRISRADSTSGILVAGLTGWHTDPGGRPR